MGRLRMMTTGSRVAQCNQPSRVLDKASIAAVPVGAFVTGRELQNIRLRPPSTLRKEASGRDARLATRRDTSARNSGVRDKPGDAERESTRP